MDLEGKCLVEFNCGKTQLASFDWSNNTGTIDMKMDVSAPEEKSSFKMLELSFSLILDWHSYIISIAKNVSKKIGTLNCSMKFLTSEDALNIYKSTIHSFIKYCYHVWAGASICYFQMLD